MEASATENLVQQVELYISLRNLITSKTINQCDPMVTVYMQEKLYGDSKCLGQTEVINNSLDPDFKTGIPVLYKFEAHQKLQIIVGDASPDGQLLGQIHVSLGSIVASGIFEYEKDLHECSDTVSNGKGRMIVKVQMLKKAKTDKEILHLKISAKDLPLHRSCFSKVCAPQLEILKAVRFGDQTNYYRVYTSETQHTQNPSFRPIQVSMVRLCNTDQDAPIKLKFFNIINGRQNIIGELDTTVNQLMDLRDADIINPISKQQQGQVSMEEFKFKESPNSFLEYLECGWQINTAVAIDYTESNGEPNLPRSLHFQGRISLYQQAIQVIGSILEVYDSDKMFSVYGFGGAPPGSWSVSHCFPLTGNNDKPEVKGTEGILEIYKDKMSHITLSGPTKFEPVIKQMIQLARQKEHQPIYHILLILTDGEIEDMEKTKSAIVEASTLPMSIIIVGIGFEGFAKMRELDSDEAILRDKSGMTAVRDIVQFIKYKYVSEQPDLLAFEVLKKIPDQFIKYMQYKGKYVG